MNEGLFRFVSKYRWILIFVGLWKWRSLVRTSRKPICGVMGCGGPFPVPSSRKVISGEPRFHSPLVPGKQRTFPSNLALVLCLVFLSALSRAQEATLEPSVEWSLGFPHVVQTYAHDPVAKSQFAVTALTEMAVALSVETDLARQQASTLSDRGLTRWIVSVERYIDELLRLAQSVEIDTPVKLLTGPEGHLFLLLKGQSIMVSAPRMELQSSFEQRVVQQFCSQFPCERAMERNAATTGLNRVSVGAPPRWSFSADGPSCNSDDGLVLQFESMADLPAKREMCLQLVNELRSLASELAHLQGRGVLVNWAGLAVHSIPGSDEHQIDINTGGEALRLPLGALAANPGLLELVQPWLHARAANKPYTLVLAISEALVAEAPQG